jgi:hypothetical protein
MERSATRGTDIIIGQIVKTFLSIHVMLEFITVPQFCYDSNILRRVPIMNLQVHVIFSVLLWKDGKEYFQR